MRHASLFILFLVLSSLLVVTAPVRAGETQYYALSFDGEDDYVEVQDSASLDLQNRLSIVVILKYPRSGHPLDRWSGQILYKTNYAGPENGAGYYLDVQLGNDGIAGWFVRFGFYTNASEEPQVIISKSEYDGFGRYTMITAEADVNAGWSRVVINNFSYVEERTFTESFIRSSSGIPLGISKGLVSDVVLVLLYNRALSDSEIQQIYNDPLNPPTDGLVLWLAPDSVDTAQNKWLDKSGNGNDGTIYGATYVPLRPVSESTPSASAPYGLYFDGVDDYVYINNIISAPRPTLVVFFTAKDLSNDQKIFRSYEWRIILGITSTNKPWLELWDRNGDRISSFVVNYQLETKKEYMLAFSYGYDSIVRAYINGQFVQSYNPSAYGYSTDDVGSFNSAYIGAYSPTSGLFNGTVYMLLLYARSLSDEEIKQIYEDPLDPPKDGLVLFYAPDSVDTANGKWLNRAPIFPTIPLAEELDATNYGATAERVSIPSLHVYDIENNSEIPISNVSVAMLANNTTISLIPSLLTLPYNETVKLNVSATNYLPRILQFFTPVNTLDVYLQPKNQCESLNVEQAVNATELVKNITSYVNITPINSYAKAFIDSGGSFGDTIKLALKGDSLMRFILPQVLILAIVIVVLVQTTSPLAALGGALIGWAMSLGILGEAPSLRNSSMTFMLVVFLVAWTLWDLFYNYSRET